MLLMLIEKKYPLDTVVFYNTGMEFDCIYQIRDRVKTLLSAYGIEFVELSPDTPFLYSMFSKPVKERSGGTHLGYSWCGGSCRWGTTEKLRAISKYKKSLNEDVIDYVGIAADETKRFDKAKSEGKILPLIDFGMTEKMCLDYCHNNGWFWYERSERVQNGCIELYDILDRVSCWCCANKNRNELKNIYKYLPQYWDRLSELQSQTNRPMKRFCNKRYGAYGNIFDMERVFCKEIFG